jgi:hypothetical protein
MWVRLRLGRHCVRCANAICVRENMCVCACMWVRLCVRTMCARCQVRMLGEKNNGKL